MEDQNSVQELQDLVAQLVSKTLNNFSGGVKGTHRNRNG
jgi:hypothetical protein